MSPVSIDEMRRREARAKEELAEKKKEERKTKAAAKRTPKKRRKRRSFDPDFPDNKPGLEKYDPTVAIWNTSNAAYLLFDVKTKQPYPWAVEQGWKVWTVTDDGIKELPVGSPEAIALWRQNVNRRIESGLEFPGWKNLPPEYRRKIGA